MVIRQQQAGDKTYHVDFDWEKIDHSLYPETKDLPQDDREFFESKVKYLIGKEIKLSNIPEFRIFMFIKRIDWVIKIMRYPQLFSRDYVRFEIVALLARLGIQISINGLGWKYGPMGFQFKEEKIRQEITSIPQQEGV